MAAVSPRASFHLHDCRNDRVRKNGQGSIFITASFRGNLPSPEEDRLVLLERLRFRFTPNGRREFVPHDHVFPLFPFTLYCFYTKISSFMPVFTLGIVRDCFYLLIFYFEKFSTWVWRLPFAVNVNLNLSIHNGSLRIKKCLWPYHTLNSSRELLRLWIGIPILTDVNKRNLIVFDDQMIDASKDKRIVNLFIRGSHHPNLSVIYIVQNLFHQGNGNRSISLNSHYLVLFKNP